MPQVWMFILIRLNEHVSSIIMPIVRRTDYVNNCMWSMPGCVGCSRADCVHCVKIGTRLYTNLHTVHKARVPTCTTAAITTRHTPHAVVYIVCSPETASVV